MLLHSTMEYGLNIFNVNDSFLSLNELVLKYNLSEFIYSDYRPGDILARIYKTKTKTNSHLLPEVRMLLILDFYEYTNQFKVYNITSKKMDILSTGKYEYSLWLKL